MKAKIGDNGELIVIAENPMETFALKHWVEISYVTARGPLVDDTLTFQYHNDKKKTKKKKQQQQDDQQQ